LVKGTPEGVPFCFIGGLKLVNFSLDLRCAAHKNVSGPLSKWWVYGWVERAAVTTSESSGDVGKDFEGWVERFEGLW
jgi:hypothetical protein